MANVKIEIDSESLETLLGLKNEIEQKEKQWPQVEREYEAAKAKWESLKASLEEKRKEFDQAVSSLTNDNLKALLSGSHVRAYLPTATNGAKASKGFNENAAALIRAMFNGKSVVEFKDPTKKEIATKAGCSIDEVNATLKELGERAEPGMRRFTKYKLKA